MPQLWSFKGQSNDYQGFLGTWCLKVSPHSDSDAHRQFLYPQSGPLRQINSKKGSWFFCKVYFWSTAEVYLRYTYIILLESTL